MQNVVILGVVANTKKWQVEQMQLAERDLVVEVDSTQLRGCWKLAIV